MAVRKKKKSDDLSERNLAEIKDGLCEFGAKLVDIALRILQKKNKKFSLESSVTVADIEYVHQSKIFAKASGKIRLAELIETAFPYYYDDVAKAQSNAYDQITTLANLVDDADVAEIDTDKLVKLVERFKTDLYSAIGHEPPKTRRTKRAA